MTRLNSYRALMAGLALLAASPVLAADICHRGNVLLNGSSFSTIYGEPIEVSMTWPIDALAPPELLAKPVELQIDDLFDDLLSRTDKADCKGDSMSGAINCVIDDMAGREREIATENSSTEGNPKTILDAVEIIDGPNLSKEVAATLKLRPVYYLTNPPQIGLMPIGGKFMTNRDLLSPEVAARANADWQAYIGQLRSASMQLSPELIAQLSEGETIQSGSMFGFEGSPNSKLSVPGDFSLPPACQSLFALRYQSGAEQQELQEASRRLQLLKSEKKRYEDLPFIDRMLDDRSVEKFDTQIRIAENRVRKASKAAKDTRDRIAAQEKKLNQAEHDAQLDAIGFDPELIKAADLQRSQKAVEAYRDYRLHEKQRAAVIAEYKRGLDDFDQKIANAPDDSSRIGLQEQKDRYQRAFDGWTDQSNMATSSRFKELARQFAENDQDGLGPKTFGELQERVERFGSKPEDVLENYLEEEINQATRIAQSDKTTLGGSATRANDKSSFIRDTALAFSEEYEKAQIGPGELIDKLSRYADGEEDVFADEAQFWNRFSRYAKGAAQGGVNGVFDTVGVLHDGLTLGLEHKEAQIEDALSFVTGRDVKLDYFGDRKTKAFDKAVQGAGDALYGAFSANDLNPLRNLPTPADLWDDPLKMGAYVLDRAQAFSEGVSTATDKIVSAADNKLAEVTRGGEKALGDTLESTGEKVGEFSDIGTGFIAFGEAARLARQLARATDLADDATDIARAARVGSELSSADNLVDAARTTPLSGPVPASANAPRKIADDFIATQIDRAPVIGDRGGPALPLPADSSVATRTDHNVGNLVAASDDLPPANFAKPIKPAATPDPREAVTHMTPADKLGRDLDTRYNDQLISDYSSATQKSAGTVLTDVEAKGFQLPPQSEIILNDGQKYVLGDKMGKGGFKQVYSVPSDARVVDKVVSYPAALLNERNPLSVDLIDEVIYDSEVGRTLLQQVEREAGGNLFSVTKRRGKPILVDDPLRPQNKFLITREDNIASPVEKVGADGSVQTVMVTNAEQRFALRANQTSTEAERLTMQLTLRKLNEQGLVWTDHKLSNFDIVPDELSPTGHRMVLFDHDAVRVVEGANAAERSSNARKTQQIVDSLEGTGPNEFWRKMENGGLQGEFNDQIFGKPMPFLATPKVNLKRKEFLAMNDMSPEEFGALVKEFSAKTGREIPYNIARP